MTEQERVIIQDGDLWLKPREAGYRGTKQFAVWVHRAGEWQNTHEAWGFVELRAACDERGLTKIANRPQFATYTGIYRYPTTPEPEPMALADAFDVLRNGHGIIAPESARAICAAFPNVALDERLILTWADEQECMSRYGIFPRQVGPGRGVGVLELGYSILEQLQIEAPGRMYSGKGFQAKANVEALATWVS